MSLNDTILFTTEDLECIEQIEKSKASDIEYETENEEESLYVPGWARTADFVWH